MLAVCGRWNDSHTRIVAVCGRWNDSHTPMVAVFNSVTSTVDVVLEGSLGEELFDAITDDAEVGLEIEILIGTAVDWVPPEVVDDFEFAPESGAVLKRSSAVLLLEVVPPGTLPLSLSVVTRNTVSLS